MPEIPRPHLRLRPNLASLRLAIRASRWPRVLLVVAVALSGGMVFDHAREAAIRAEQAWSPPERVWVAVADLAAGATISPNDVEARPLPAAALPTDVVLETPVGRRLRDAVVVGEILRLGRLSDGSTGVLAARLPDGAGGLQLPTATPQLSAGDVVDLYALLTGERVATRAEVISLDEGFPTVAVAAVDIPAVVRSFTTGDVVPVVVG